MADTYTVLAHRLPEAIKSLEKLAKKATKYNSGKISWNVRPVEQTVRTVSTDYGDKKILVHTHTIELFGFDVAPKVGEHDFLAKIEILPGGNIIDNISGITLPHKYRETKGECEHCKHNRYRKHVFVLKNEQGELVQVGRSCLRDYLGTDTPESVIQKFNLISEVRSFSEDFEGFGSGLPKDNTEELLAVTSAAIRVWGWIPKSKADDVNGIVATATTIRSWFHGMSNHDLEIKSKIREELNSSDWELALKIREWIKTVDTASEYLYNLQVILSSDIVDEKRRGYACSAVSAYLRAHTVEEEKVESISQHVGEVGEKLSNLKVKCTMSRGFQSDWGNGVHYKFVDDNGNHYNWFASSTQTLAIGDEYIIKGTVKKHSEYNSVKETHLSRVKVISGKGN